MSAAATTTATQPSPWAAYLKSLQEKGQRKIDELAQKDSFDVGGRQYRRCKITARQHQELEEMRAELAELKTADAKKVASVLFQIYQKGAQYYLGMAGEEFLQAPWDEVKAIVDACAWRTMHGSAFL